MSERKSALAQALEARKRELVEFDASSFIKATGAEMGKLKIYVATKLEQDQAIAQAHKYVDELTRSSPHATEDPDIVLDAKTVHILHRVIRDASDPYTFPAFPTPRWMMEHLNRDEIAVLLNMYNGVAEKFSPMPKTIDQEFITDLAEVVANTARYDLPQVRLYGLTREMLEMVVVELAQRIQDGSRTQTRSDSLPDGNPREVDQAQSP